MLGKIMKQRHSVRFFETSFAGLNGIEPNDPTPFVLPKGCRQRARLILPIRARPFCSAFPKLASEQAPIGLLGPRTPEARQSAHQSMPKDGACTFIGLVKLFGALFCCFGR